MLPRPASSKPPPPNYKLGPWLEPTGRIPFVFGGQDTSRLLPERVIISHVQVARRPDGSGLRALWSPRHSSCYDDFPGRHILIYIWRLIA